MAGLFDTPANDSPDTSLFAEPAVPAQHAGAYRVLARTYRPRTFEDLIGQDVLVRTLRNAFTLGRIAHAFMLTGVRGVGKTTTARIIARCLNCIGPDGNGGPTAEPCGVCANCQAILADRHPDVMEMDAASRTGVDDAREIIEATRFRPMQARTKVFIIDEVHMLSRQAFNALLKTLEEPPPHVKFIFATTELRKVPVTVLSRCQRFDLRRVPAALLVARFGQIAAREQVTVAPEALEMLARAADGSVRDGLSLLDQAMAQNEAGGEIGAASVAAMLGLADRSLVFDLLEAVFAGRLPDALALTGQAHAHGADFGHLMQDLLELVHTLTRLATLPELRDSRDLPELERVRGGAMAARLTVPELARAWQVLLKGIQEVELASDRRAAAEMVLIRLGYLADTPTPGELVRQLQQPRPAPGTPPTGGRRALIGGGAQPVAVAVAVESPPAPVFTTLQDIAAAVAQGRAHPELHAHLVHSVHLVRLAPGLIEFRPEPDAPRGLAAELGAFLLAHGGQRWTVAVSTAAGDPTLAQQAEVADRARRSDAEAHPLVRAILETFPGATVAVVHDPRADTYGLYQDQVVSLAGTAEPVPDMPDFAPEDAVFAEAMP